MKKIVVLSLIMGVAPRIVAMENSHENRAEKALQYANFMIAIRNGDYDKVVALHEEGVPLTGHERGTPLRFIVEDSEYVTDDQQAKIAGYLIDNGAEINLSPEELDRGVKPVIYDACVFGNTKMVELLLKRGAKVDFESTGVDLFAACFDVGGYSHDHEIVELLLDAGCSLTRLEPEWLREFAKIGDIACVKLLIQSGMGLRKNAKNWDNPLVRAAHARQWQSCGLLLEAGFTEPKAAHKCKDLQKFCAQAYQNLVYSFEGTVDQSHQDDYKKVPQFCSDLVTSQKVLDTFEKEIIGFDSAPYDISALRKQSLEKLAEFIYDGTLKKEDIIDLDKACDEEIVALIHRYQRAKLFALIDCLKSGEITPPDKSQHTKFLNTCEEIAAAYKTIDVLKKYCNNPLPLKYQCINQIRKLVKEGKLKKEELPKLDEFGFHRIIVPQEDTNDDNNNNNEEEK